MSTGVSIVLASTMWFWGKMEKENRILYFSCQVFILVNDTPISFFEISRDVSTLFLHSFFFLAKPLSPLLFVIVMEALSRLITRAVSEGYLSGFSIDSF